MESLAYTKPGAHRIFCTEQAKKQEMTPAHGGRTQSVRRHEQYLSVAVQSASQASRYQRPSSVTQSHTLSDGVSVSALSRNDSSGPLCLNSGTVTSVRM